MSFSVQLPIYQEINQSAHHSVHQSIKISLYVDSVVTVNQSTYRCLYRPVLGAHNHCEKHVTSCEKTSSGWFVYIDGNGIREQ